MSYLMSVVLGFVQGVAEFLPISSSGHLSLFQYFFGMDEPDGLFNILLHFATLLAICIYYFQDIKDMVLEFFRTIGDMIHHTSPENVPEARRMILLLIVGSLPLFLVLPIEDQVQALGGNHWFLSIMLIITGCLLFFSDRMAKGKKNARSVPLKDILLVGFAQLAATTPGLSRSGCTISAGMALGFDRKFAVRFSFLLSLPAVLAATMLEVIQTIVQGADISVSVLPKYLLGMVVAGVVGYTSLWILEMLTSKGKFGAFAYYCWAAGVASLILGMLGWRLV